MSDFYDSLSSVYDIVFPVNPAATDFLSRDVHPGSRILDLACGTGTYALALARKGHFVVGIDLDERMIAEAKRKDPDGAVVFLAGDMLDAGSLCAGRTFDLAYCIGNSFVHLPGREQAAAFLSTVHGLLADGGRFIIQIVNFDRVLANNDVILPTIDRKSDSIILTRRYDIGGDGCVSFVTELTISGEKTINSVRLLALCSAELTDMLETAGYRVYGVYGGYDGSSFDDRSPALIVKACKYQ